MAFCPFRLHTSLCLCHSSAGCLEGCQTSPHPFSPSGGRFGELQALQETSFPARLGGKEGILGRPGTLWVPPQTPPPRKFGYEVLSSPSSSACTSSGESCFARSIRLAIVDASARSRMLVSTGGSAGAWLS